MYILPSAFKWFEKTLTISKGRLTLSPQKQATDTSTDMLQYKLPSCLCFILGNIDQVCMHFSSYVYLCAYCAHAYTLIQDVRMHCKAGERVAECISGSVMGFNSLSWNWIISLSVCLKQGQKVNNIPEQKSVKILQLCIYNYMYNNIILHYIII